MRARCSCVACVDRQRERAARRRLRRAFLEQTRGYRRGSDDPKIRRAIRFLESAGVPRDLIPKAARIRVRHRLPGELYGRVAPDRVIDGSTFLYRDCVALASLLLHEQSHVLTLGAGPDEVTAYTLQLNFLRRVGASHALIGCRPIFRGDKRRMTTSRRLDVVSRLRGEFGQRLVVLDWWREALERLDDPATRELVLSLPRQSGKSQLLAAMAVSELFTKPGAFVLFVAASESQAQAIFTRKIQKPLAALLRGLGVGRRSVTLTKRGIEIASTGSGLEVIATNEATGTGRSPTVLMLDESRDIPTGIYTAYAPSVIGAGGKIVIASTAGAPRGFMFEILQNPTPETWVYRSSENTNPHADRGVLDFLRRRLALFGSSAGRRELENEFADDGESFLSRELIDAAIDDRLGEIETSDAPAFCFEDLSRKRDLTSRVVVLRVAARHPETTDHLVVASIRIWNPKQSPTRETPFEDVRADLADLPRRFPRLEKVLIDEGSEAGSVLPYARSHPALAGRVDGFMGSVESNLALWSALSARLHARTVSIPRHERLLGELRGLRQESFSFGSRWRIVDSSRAYHRDVSLALAGACFAAGQIEHMGPIDKWVHEVNQAAAPTGSATAMTFYGASGGGSLEERAFGDVSGVHDLGRRAFGS